VFRIRNLGCNDFEKLSIQTRKFIQILTVHSIGIRVLPILRQFILNENSFRNLNKNIFLKHSTVEAQMQTKTSKRKDRFKLLHLLNEQLNENVLVVHWTTTLEP
jgi:hypothetical protein